MSTKKKAPPPTFAERSFKLIPKRTGAGYQIAEMRGQVDGTPDEIKVRRWDSVAREFGGVTRIKRTQVVGDVPTGDARMAYIAAAVNREIEKHEAEAAK